MEKDIHVRLDHCYSGKVLKYVEDCINNGVKMYVDAKRGKTPYSCPLCNKGFFQHKVMYNHINTDHKVIKCEKCNLVLSCLKTLKRHLKENSCKNRAAIREFKCTKCGKKFDCKPELRLHEYRHKLFKPFCCSVCKKRFKGRSSFIQHMSARRCFSSTSCTSGKSIASKESRSDDALEKHMTSQNESTVRLQKYNHPGTSFRELKNFCHLHNETVCNCEENDRTSMPNYPIDKLDLLEKRPRAIISHPYRCDICGKTFRFKETYDEHQLVHLKVDNSRSPKFPCNFCPKKFRHKETLDEHVLVHAHASRDGRTLCHSIDLSSKHKGKNVSITVEKTYRCEFCDVKFECQETYDVHRLTHALNKRDEPSEGIDKSLRSIQCEKTHKCSVCDMTFQCKKTCEEHVLVHENDQTSNLLVFQLPVSKHCEKINSCAVGDLKLKSTEIYAKHVLVREINEPQQDKMYAMNDLNFKPTETYDNYMHVQGKDKTSELLVMPLPMRDEKTHSCFVNDLRFRCKKTVVAKEGFSKANDKLYRCGECAERFIVMDSLKEHFKLHLYRYKTGPFECEICFKKFSTQISLRWHMKIHIGELPYLCQYCGDFFDNSLGHKIHEHSHRRKFKKLKIEL